MNDTRKKILTLLCTLLVVGGVAFAVVIIFNINNKNIKGTNDNTVPEERLIIMPSQSFFYEGDEFVRPNVVLEYDNGTQIGITESDNLTFSGYDLNRVGEYDVVVQYSESGFFITGSYKVTVYSRVVSKIQIECLKNEIIWGERLEQSDLIVTAVFADDHREKVKDYTLTYNSKPSQYGPITVTVKYGVCSAQFLVNVVGKSIDNDYKLLEEEAILLCKRFGIENPSSPKDYELEFDKDGHPNIKFLGTLSEELNNSEQQYNYLANSVFFDYLQVGDPEESMDMLFLSTKYKFSKPASGVSVYIYITQLLGKTHYTALVGADK